MDHRTNRIAALAGICAAVLAIAAAPAAAAGSRLVIRGAGLGHGVGMSQYGAYGYALQGDDYRTILAHYYTGTTLQPAGGTRTVRVLLKTSSTARVSGASSTIGERTLDPAKTYTVAPTAAGQVTVRDVAGELVATATAPLRIGGSTTTPLRLLGKAANGVVGGRYRGALEFRPTPAGRLLTINALGLENYVRGVVSAESPSNWPAAALQAQAVAARTYAITTARSVTNGFDQFADTRSQVYRGIAAETPTTDTAVASTADEIVAYKGAPAVTYFFSTSGGRTENVENVFPGAKPAPWLVSVDDPYDATSPVHRWGPVTKSMTSATRAFKGLVMGDLRAIRVTKRGSSPRIVAAELVGTTGTTRVSGAQLKARLGLRDTWISFRLVNANGKTVKMPGGAAPLPTDTVPAVPPPPTTTPTTTTTTGGTTIGGGASDGTPTTTVPGSGGAGAP